MSRRLLLFIVAGLLAIAIAVPVAQAARNRGPQSNPQQHVAALVALGSGFTYQGRLTDGGGPANSVYDLRFILYDADAGGSQVGSTVEKADLTVQNGLFTTEIDFGVAAYDGNARWMEIAIRPGASAGGYTVLSPRQAVTPVPYALYAKSAAGMALPFTGTATTPSVGLLDINQSGEGIGVQSDRTYTGTSTNPAILGTNAGSGSAVAGITTYDGVAAYGVVGDASQATTGTGAFFKGPTALEIDGPLKVSGNKAAFTVTGDSGDFCDTSAMVIDSPLTNGDANALILVTYVGSPTVALSIDYDVESSAGCNDRWVIYGLPDGEAANVLVIKQ